MSRIKQCAAVVGMFAAFMVGYELGGYGQPEGIPGALSDPPGSRLCRVEKLGQSEYFSTITGERTRTEPSVTGCHGTWDIETSLLIGADKTPPQVGDCFIVWPDWQNHKAGRMVPCSSRHEWQKPAISVGVVDDEDVITLYDVCTSDGTCWRTLECSHVIGGGGWYCKGNDDSSYKPKTDDDGVTDTNTDEPMKSTRKPTRPDSCSWDTKTQTLTCGDLMLERLSEDGEIFSSCSANGECREILCYPITQGWWCW